MRKTIYVPEGYDWDGLKVRADDAGLSVSEFLLSGQGAGGKFFSPRFLEERLSSIESKLDGLIKVYRIEHSEGPVKEAAKIIKDYTIDFENGNKVKFVDDGEVHEGHPDSVPVEKITPQEEEILRKAMTKIPNAIKTVSDIPDRYKPVDFMGGVPKASQLGKRGAK